MKILVLGGTGAMGRHLVTVLAESGGEIFVTTRRCHESAGNITYLQGDAHDGAFMEKLLAGHWDAIVDFMVYSTPEFKESMPRLLDSAGQYVFLSSARVYADSEAPLTENSPRLLDVCDDAEYLRTNEYALAKARQEDILRDSGRNHWTIIRPYITFSESRLQLGVLEKESWLYRALHGRPIVFSEDLVSNTTTLTYGYDVARGIAGVIGNAAAFGEAFHITHPESHSWNEILSVYLDVLEEHLGTRPSVFLTEKSSALKYGKYQILYDRYFQRRFDNSKIGALIELSSFKSPLTGLKECLGCFLKNPQFLDISCRIEAEFDQWTHSRTPLCEFSGLKQKGKYLIARYFL